MKPKRIESWEKIRQKGAWHYGLIYGSFWGLFVVAFLIAIDVLIGKEHKILSNLFIWIPLYVTVGIFLYRFLMWKINETYYQKWLSGNNK